MFALIIEQEAKQGSMRQVKKHDLPSKDCPICGRPFRWRKKWKAIWDDIVYCSERCRKQRKKKLTADASTKPTSSSI